MSGGMQKIEKIGFVVFPKMTLLDLVGGYDSLRRVGTMGIDSNVEVTVLGTHEKVTDDSGLGIVPDAVRGDLTEFDLLYVPGGLLGHVQALIDDPEIVEWVQSWGRDKPIVSVCTGSLLLGAAGHLEGLPATTHHKFFEELQQYASVVSEDRIVDTGRVVTAGGVASSLDLGLHLVEKYWGSDSAAKVATQMEYRWAPSSDSLGSVVQSVDSVEE